MPTIRACIEIEGPTFECDRKFADKRNQLRGLFDIVSLDHIRKGLPCMSTRYTFCTETTYKDAPVVLEILRDLGFQAKGI